MVVYINGTGGVMLCVCLVTALIFSLLNYFAVRNSISFEMKCENTNLRKGDSFQVELTVSKKSLFPTPYVEIKLRSSPKLTAVNAEIFKTAMFSKKKPLKISAGYRADFSGMSFVEIEYVRLTDYLGLISKNIYVKSDGNFNTAELKVLPDIPENNTPADLIKSACDAAAFDDNEEDTGETARFGGGIAGYEHRAYIPGDPVKKINWKLSSKRDIYMIRLDEKIAVTSQIMVLDVVSKDSSRIEFSNNDLLIESCLAMLSSMIMQELKCDCYFYSKDSWQKIEVCDEKSLYEFQRAMAVYDDFKNHSSRIPQEIFKEKGTAAAIVFTNNLDYSLENEGNTPLLRSFFVTTDRHLKYKSENMWIVNDMYEFKRI